MGIGHLQGLFLYLRLYVEHFQKRTQHTRVYTPQRDTIAYTVCHFLISFHFYCSSSLDKSLLIQSSWSRSYRHSLFIPSWPISALSRFWHFWQLWWLLSLFFLSSDCCHFPFVVRAQYPESFLTNWFLTMRFSVSKTYLTCTFEWWKEIFSPFDTTEDALYFVWHALTHYFRCNVPLLVIANS